MQRILSYMRRAVTDYEMIKPGDKIAVGVSGGKDSLCLLEALSRYQKFSPVPFSIEAITIDMGLEGMDFEPVKEFCQKLGVNYTIRKTEIAQVVFEYRKEKNPCSLCAKMRRGALNNAAKELLCNKVALGHHSDDVVETFFLCLL
ncbi:MAG: ATP-binding protein, partial [Bacillota bacterium]|nr:ATP-binding protein [Bacillota bacterium]